MLSSSTPSEPERLYDSKAIWGHLSPKSKHNMTCALKISPNTPKGFNHAAQKVLGLIISNLLEVVEKIETPLQEIPVFCDRSDNAKPCPEMKRMVVDTSKRGKHIPAWYRLGTIRMLHWRFEAEKGAVCSLEWFREKHSL